MFDYAGVCLLIIFKSFHTTLREHRDLKTLRLLDALSAGFKIVDNKWAFYACIFY